MKNDDKEEPEIFISYSWSSPEHITWVIDLANRLTADGVEVHIDKWDLKEGQDKYAFMERMVKSKNVGKVLIILDKKYKEKADGRKDGVGVETQIISPEIYKNVSQDKFIPIIAERDDEGKFFVPNYLESRIYIDLSQNEHYESNYEDLLRNLWNRPEYPKPEKGSPPRYLFEDKPQNHKISSLVRIFDNQIDKNPNRLNSLIREFLDEFFISLKKYDIEFSDRKNMEIIGKEVCDNINSYTPLRDQFIIFFKKVTKNDLEQDLDVDIIIKFLENLHLLDEPGDRTTWSSFDFANYKFFIHELFLYLIVLGLKNENYVFVEELLYSDYLLKGRHNENEFPVTFEEFYNNMGDMIKQYYDKVHSTNFVNPMADLMIKRVPEGYYVDDLADADLLCYYVAVIKNHYWFPITYIYKENRNFELFRRIVSRRHFEKIKILFNVENIEELKDKLKEIRDNDTNPRAMRYSSYLKSVKPIYQVINIENMGTIR